jgi:hypothetical protein
MEYPRVHTANRIIPDQNLYSPLYRVPQAPRHQSEQHQGRVGALLPPWEVAQTHSNGRESLKDHMAIWAKIY